MLDVVHSDVRFVDSLGCGCIRFVFFGVLLDVLVVWCVPVRLLVRVSVPKAVHLEYFLSQEEMVFFLK